MCYPICRHISQKRGVIILKFQNNHTTTITSFEDFILTVFVIVDNLYPKYLPAAVSKWRNIFMKRPSNSENITISLCSELVGIDFKNARFSFVKKITAFISQALQLHPFEPNTQSTPNGGRDDSPKTVRHFFYSIQLVFYHRQFPAGCI